MALALTSVSCKGSYFTGLLRLWKGKKDHREPTEKENTATVAVTVFPRGLKHSDCYMRITLRLLLFSLTSLISWGSLCLSNIHLLAVPSQVSVLMVQMPPPGPTLLPLLLPTMLVCHRIQPNLLCRSAHQLSPAPGVPGREADRGCAQWFCPRKGTRNHRSHFFLHAHLFPGRGRNQSATLLCCRLQLSSCVKPFFHSGKTILEIPQYRGTFYCGEPARGSLAEGFA